jgi:hypothetical protein
MLSRKFLSLGAAFAVVVLALPAFAQQSSDTPAARGYGPGYGPGMMAQGRGYGPGMMGEGWMMGPGMMGRGFGDMMCDPRSTGFAEWRIDRIERAVKLDDAQKKALDELRAASGKAAEAMAAACPREIPASSAERLALMEKRMEAMLQSVKTVRPAFEAFYNSLTAEQKASVDRAGPRRWGWHRWRWS